jgi:hypothetical protein
MVQKTAERIVASREWLVGRLKQAFRIFKGMKPEYRSWIDAAIILGNNPKERVSCPECKVGILPIIDVPFGEDKIDRYMHCEACGKWNVMIMLKPESEQ